MVSVNKIRYFVVVVIATMMFSIVPQQPSDALSQTMRTGTYVGTGKAKTISGLGFQPSGTIVKAANNSHQ